MALVNCPECKKQISDAAEICPNCGYPILTRINWEMEKDEKPQKSKKIYTIITIISCIFFPFLGTICVWVFKKPKKNWKRILLTVFLLFYLLIKTLLNLYIEPEVENFENETDIIEENIENEENIEFEICIDEQIIYDKNDVKIYAKSISDKGSYYSLDIYVENNSNLNLGFNAHSYAINKINTGNNIFEMDCDVASGKKANTSLEIDKQYFDFINTSPIKSIDLLIWAYDNDASFKEFDTDQITINTNLYDGQIEVLLGEKIYEKNGIVIEYIGNDENKYYFQLFNNSDTYLDFNVDNLTINDYTSSEMDLDLYGISALEGCVAIFFVEPSQEFIETNEISEIEKIEFTLEVLPMEDYHQEWNTEMIAIEF